jgi:hypothetical protein
VDTNAPALQRLDVSSNDLDDSGVLLMVQALPHNTHLRTFCCGSNELSEQFCRDELLPAVRANASLRELDAAEHPMMARTCASALEAMALVAARSSGAPPAVVAVAVQQNPAA